MLEQMQRPVARKARVSVESLLDQLDQTIEAARADGQHSVVVNALTLSAKLVGLLRERVTIEHEFVHLDTPEKVLDQIRLEFGDEAARAIEKALDAADQDVLVGS